ncbi:MAG: hypothetical protein EA403_10415 [Spirochaetaceae bacterium]|nr:MAG: hypothetical protein EA403_10415 [Spirochaetaceae bacterium]
MNAETRTPPPSQRWQRFYNVWGLTASAAILIVTALVVLPLPFAIASRSAASLLVAGTLAVLLAALYWGAGDHRGGFHVANLVTAVRTLCVVGLLAWLSGGEARGGALDLTAQWVVFAVLVLAELSDMADGAVARRFGATPFGATWDMENDVLFSVGLCVLAHRWFGLGGWVVISSLFHPVYFLLFGFQSDPPHTPAVYKLFAKTVCALQMIALISAGAPFLPLPLASAFNAVVIVLLAVSFGWDLALRPQLCFRWSRSSP